MRDDHTDSILKQWAREKPELDTSPMAITGRIAKIAAFFSREMQATFKRFGLNMASFDLLATLLRSGPPYALSPSKLLASTMVTSGTMTNRIDRLEEAGLVDRQQKSDDKRCFTIHLTDKGLALINDAIVAHTTTLHRLVDTISTNDRDNLSALLKQITCSFELAEPTGEPTC